MAKTDRKTGAARSEAKEPLPLYDPFEQLLRRERNPLTTPWAEDNIEPDKGRFRDAAE